jgi:hypothetical protein
MARFQARRVPQSAGSPDQTPSRADSPRSERRSVLRAVAGTESEAVGGPGEASNAEPDPVGPPDRVHPASYLIALSQTDTVEQAKWAHALAARRNDCEGLS